MIGDSGSAQEADAAMQFVEQLWKARRRKPAESRMRAFETLTEIELGPEMTPDEVIAESLDPQPDDPSRRDDRAQNLRVHADAYLW